MNERQLRQWKAFCELRDLLDEDLTDKTPSDRVEITNEGKDMQPWEACADHGVNREFCTEECDLSTEQVFNNLTSKK